MTTKIQTIHTFAQELKSIGVVIPEDVQKITISVKGADKPVVIVFHQLNLDSPVVKKAGVKIVSKDGSQMLGKEFYNLVKESAQLPDETTAFTITANMNEVVMVEIKSAFPIGGLSNLQGCTFK